MKKMKQMSIMTALILSISMLFGMGTVFAAETAEDPNVSIASLGLKARAGYTITEEKIEKLEDELYLVTMVEQDLRGRATGTIGGTVHHYYVRKTSSGWETVDTISIAASFEWDSAEPSCVVYMYDTTITEQEGTIGFDLGQETVTSNEHVVNGGKRKATYLRVYSYTYGMSPQGTEKRFSISCNSDGKITTTGDKDIPVI